MKDFKVKFLNTTAKYFLLGKVYNVVKNTLIDEDGDEWVCSSVDEWNEFYTSKIELADESSVLCTNAENIRFKKDDLQSMMVIEERDGTLALVHESKWGILFSDITKKGFTKLSEYDQFLKTDYDVYDVVKVYSPKSKNAITHLMNGKSLEGYELIWEEKKEVELTLDEIAKKFGVKVENLKIKK